MAAGPAALIAAHCSSTISISKNTCINYGLRHPRQTLCRQCGGNCRMIQASIRMATSVTVRVGGIIQGCISQACIAGAAPSLPSLVQRPACLPRWPRGKRSMTKRTSSRRMVSAPLLPPERCIEYHTSVEFHVWPRKASRGRGMMPEYFLFSLYTVRVCSN